MPKRAHCLNEASLEEEFSELNLQSRGNLYPNKIQRYGTKIYVDDFINSIVNLVYYKNIWKEI